jgi:hypothetical protein
MNHKWLTAATKVVGEYLSRYTRLPARLAYRAAQKPFTTTRLPEIGFLRLRRCWVLVVGKLSLLAGFQGLDPDTLYARIEWRTLGGKALREPLDFKTINVR